MPPIRTYDRREERNMETWHWANPGQQQPRAPLNRIQERPPNPPPRPVDPRDIPLPSIESDYVDPPRKRRVVDFTDDEEGEVETPLSKTTNCSTALNTTTHPSAIVNYLQRGALQPVPSPFEQSALVSPFQPPALPPLHVISPLQPQSSFASYQQEPRMMAAPMMQFQALFNGPSQRASISQSKQSQQVSPLRPLSVRPKTPPSKPRPSQPQSWKSPLEESTAISQLAQPRLIGQRPLVSHNPKVAPVNVYAPSAFAQPPNPIAFRPTTMEEKKKNVVESQTPLPLIELQVKVSLVKRLHNMMQTLTSMPSQPAGVNLRYEFHCVWNHFVENVRVLLGEIRTMSEKKGGKESKKRADEAEALGCDFLMTVPRGEVDMKVRGKLWKGLDALLGELLGECV